MGEGKKRVESKEKMGRTLLWRMGRWWGRVRRG